MLESADSPIKSKKCLWKAPFGNFIGVSNYGKHRIYTNGYAQDGHVQNKNKNIQHMEVFEVK